MAQAGAVVFAQSVSQRCGQIYDLKTPCWDEGSRLVDQIEHGPSGCR